MSLRRHLTGIVAALLVTAGISQVAQAEPLRIAYFIWIGNGPFFVAQEKGYFAQEGVEVELINIEDHAAVFGALFAGQIDALQGAVQDAPEFSQPDQPLACVLALDASRGSDGILASKDIRTIADLEGRSVAFLRGSVGQFYLNVLLRDAGLTEADIEVVDLSAEDAAHAFLLQEVDAAVTNDPFLTQGKKAEHGHLLTDTSEQPGLIVDCLMTTARVFKDRKDDFKAVARAWAAAVDYVETHPEEASEIMARHLGGGLEEPAVFVQLLKGVGLYDAEGNREYFGTPESPGQLYQTMQQAIDLWSSLGRVQVDMSPADVIAHGIWDE